MEKAENPGRVSINMDSSLHEMPQTTSIKRVFVSSRRKQHRRAKKNWKKETTAQSTSCVGVNKGSTKVCLRPTYAPPAPRNSTQFIIDDHEDSNLFWSFDHDRRGSSTPDNVQGQYYFNAADHESFSPDDDKFWEEYSFRDFSCVYETAHRQEIAEWDRSRLIYEISTLEDRQISLVNTLSHVDPNAYLNHLHTELVTLQEKNDRLRSLKPDLPDSTIDEEYCFSMVRGYHSSCTDDSALSNDSTEDPPALPSDQFNHRSPITADQSETNMSNPISITRKPN